MTPLRSVDRFAGTELQYLRKVVAEDFFLGSSFFLSNKVSRKGEKSSRAKITFIHNSERENPSLLTMT